MMNTAADLVRVGRLFDNCMGNNFNRKRRGSERLGFDTRQSSGVGEGRLKCSNEQFHTGLGQAQKFLQKEKQPLGLGQVQKYYKRGPSTRS